MHVVRDLHVYTMKCMCMFMLLHVISVSLRSPLLLCATPHHDRGFPRSLVSETDFLPLSVTSAWLSSCTTTWSLYNSTSL